MVRRHHVFHSPGIDLRDVHHGRYIRNPRRTVGSTQTTAAHAARHRRRGQGAEIRRRSRPDHPDRRRPYREGSHACSRHQERHRTLSGDCRRRFGRRGLAAIGGSVFLPVDLPTGPTESAFPASSWSALSIAHRKAMSSSYPALICSTGPRSMISNPICRTLMLRNRRWEDTPMSIRITGCRSGFLQNIWSFFPKINGLPRSTAWPRTLVRPIMRTDGNTE